MSQSANEQFEELHAKGMEAKNRGDYEAAVISFLYADDVAESAGDERKRLDALNPAARALWMIDRYDESLEKLNKAQAIAEDLELEDEVAIAISNLGRLAAVQVVRLTPIKDQSFALMDRSTPYFEEAYKMLLGHPHFYYRYANAAHGSVAAALAGENYLAQRLIDEGQEVSSRISELYDPKKTPAQISPRGLDSLRLAELLLQMGTATPGLADEARKDIVS